jgi:hypothetical protein
VGAAAATTVATHRSMISRHFIDGLMRLARSYDTWFDLGAEQAAMLGFHAGTVNMNTKRVNISCTRSLGLT